MPEIKIDGVTPVVVQSGDVLILMCDQVVTVEDANRIKQRVQEFGLAEPLVLGRGWSLPAVYRPEARDA